jgi:hypothetical protein
MLQITWCRIAILRCGVGLEQATRALLLHTEDVQQQERVAKNTVRAKHLPMYLKSKYQIHGAPKLHQPRLVKPVQHLFKDVPCW